MWNRVMSSTSSSGVRHGNEGQVVPQDLALECEEGCSEEGWGTEGRREEGRPQVGQQEARRDEAFLREEVLGPQGLGEEGCGPPRWREARRLEALVRRRLVREEVVGQEVVREEVLGEEVLGPEVGLEAPVAGGSREARDVERRHAGDGRRPGGPRHGRECLRSFPQYGELTGTARWSGLVRRVAWR